MAVYDLVVVGAGMIGTAAAKHASRQQGHKVCLIGPSEPKTKSMEDKRDIYGCYYDEGRITRSCDPNPVLAALAQASIKRYRDIEREAGIPFYNEKGFMMISSKNSAYLENVKKHAAAQGVLIKELSNKELSKRHPYLKIAEDDVGVLEERNAGILNPRRLVEAQMKIARNLGCDMIEDVVYSVQRDVSQNGSYVMKVKTEGGGEISSKAVLLATGAFTTFRHLLPAGVSPDQRLRSLPLALVEVDQAYADKLKSFPPVIYSGKGHPEFHKFPGNTDASVFYFMLPPVKYPDGRWYVKLDNDTTTPMNLTTSKQVKEWYLHGDKAYSENTAKFIASLFRGLDLKHWRAEHCVITETPTILPYIDMVHAQLGVAIGGNGYAAKSCDEIGRLAASMMMGGWSSTIPRDVFKLRLAKDDGVPLAQSKL